MYKDERTHHSVLKRIQVSDDYISEENILNNLSVLFGKALPILDHRKRMYERYDRRKWNNEDIKVALEFYISTIATGYFGGKEPQYKVKRLNKTQQGIVKKIFNKIFKNGDDTTLEFQAIVDYITKYNDNETFFYNLVKDYVITNACYGLLYENKDNEIVYSEISSLTAVALWNYDVPSRKVGLLRCWYEYNEEGKITTNLEVITDKYKKRFVDGILQTKIDENTEFDFKEKPGDDKPMYWNDTPIFAVENPDGLSLFENVIPLIKKFEQLLKNNSNIFEHNDTAAKLKVVGYAPNEPLLIPAESNSNDSTTETETKLIKNPNRTIEDDATLKAPVVYVDKDGDIDWITKDINDTASENHKKTLLDLILMIPGVPNVTDQGFTNADNASALEKKFFPLDQTLQQADKLFKKELLRMWEMIIHRVNIKKNTNYDFRDIEITLTRNLPQNTTEIVDCWLKLRGLVSDKTIIDNLPYDLDSESEFAELEEQNERSIESNLKQMQKMSDAGVETDETEEKEDKQENKITDLSDTQKAQKLTADNKKEQEKNIKKQIKKE